MDVEIVDIEKIGRNKVRIHLSDGEHFTMYTKEWSPFALEIGDFLTFEEKEKIYMEYLLPKAKLKALNALKSRDHSTKELIQKLQRDGYPEGVIEETMAYVNHYHYMNDQRFAQNYVEYKGKNKSCKELEYELKEKGICLNALIDQGIEFSLPDDRKTIRNLINKRFSIEKMEDLKEKDRITRYLLRHGFKTNDIYFVYKDLGI